MERVLHVIIGVLAARPWRHAVTPGGRLDEPALGLRSFRACSWATHIVMVGGHRGLSDRYRPAARCRAQRLHCRAGFVGQPTPNLGDSPMQPTHNTLSQNIRAQSVELLNKHPAAIDLHAQVKQAHWNVHGPGFIAIHELFDKASGEGENYSDLIAERAGGLGGAAYGIVQVAAERSFLVPYPLGIAH